MSESPLPTIAAAVLAKHPKLAVSHDGTLDREDFATAGEPLPHERQEPDRPKRPL